jgi:thiosulfate dehydrogenase [quinone] large subunit
MTMSVIHRHRHEATAPVVEQAGAPAIESHDHGTLFHKALATLRIAFGFTFLWAFLDKTFALGFGTGAQYAEDGSRAGIDFMAEDAAWLNGGSPTEGFLSFGVPADNPFKDMFNSMAGQAWVDWLFMIGLLGIGITLLLGVGMRIGTAAGALMYAFMYLAVLPLENNPIVDDHLVGVIVMAVLALGAAGTTWGLGHWWNRMDVVKKYPALR